MMLRILNIANDSVQPASEEIARDFIWQNRDHGAALANAERRAAYDAKKDFWRLFVRPVTRKQPAPCVLCEPFVASGSPTVIHVAWCK